SLPLPSPACADCPVHLAAHLALAKRRALVVELLTTREPDLELRPAALEVEPERHQREPALGDLAGQALDLPLVEEQLAIPLRIVVGVGAVAVWADVTAEEPPLAVPHRSVGVLEVHQSGAQGLHLRPAQDEPGLERLEDLVLVARATIRGDRSVA